jgi:hypothetical protein
MLATVLFLTLAGCSSSTPASTATTGASSPAVTGSLSPAITESPPVGAAPSASLRIASRLAGIGRPMAAGTYVYEDAFPHVTFDVPNGWYLDETMPRHFGIRPKGMPADDSFIVWFDMHVASKDPSCPEEPSVGAGHAAADLATSFHVNSGIVATRSVVAGVGGLTGQVFDISLSPDWKGTCPFSDGHPTVPLFVDDNVEGEPAFWGVGGDERIRMIVLDDQHAGNVLITFDSASGSTVDAIEAAAKPVLDTFRFDVADPS